ncbi:carbohydrate ABC transporter permease [Microbacterium marinilacus]|uniref:Carbohydrate ABC transporter permease n=1 Tax=Microbacterium marinilacus TaxID=415209 RepID=A0ABP7BY09_9MICO|nr:carbohydrate ABC transporter permease [Microbacterium marinilacus]MBY0688112.1 carbohydrate ABC transporter permease [Microbacterium marinilacus]
MTDQQRATTATELLSTSGPARRRRQRKPELFDVLNGLILGLIAIACVYPFLYIVAVAFSDGRAVLQDRVFLWPVDVNTETFSYILSNERLGVVRALLNSILYTVVGTAVAVILTYLTAYALSKKRLPGARIVMLLFIITWIFDAGIVPAYIVNSGLGLVNNWLIMVLPLAISTFLLIVTKSFIEAIPDELEESAFMDGANDFQILTRIYMPLSKPVVATISIFYAVQTWNSFLWPLIYLRDASLQPIQVVLYRLLLGSDDQALNFQQTVSNGFLVIPENIRAATMLFAIVPVLLFYPYAQRYFSKGILVGAVKG